MKRNLGFIVFDMRLNLCRNPPYQPLGPNGNYNHFCYMVIHGEHAYGFQCKHFARQRMAESLSWYKAIIRVATGNYDLKEKGAGWNQRSE